MKPNIHKRKKLYIYPILCNFIVLLSGCNDLIIMHPKGQIGCEERSLILVAFGLMLIIVIPVIIMTIVFSIKYRISNIKNHIYHAPNWNHSRKIELITWSVPILIIILLSILTWKSTHKLDPKSPIIYGNIQPIIIDVISLDWKWLFIYPQQKIAVINELVFPINTPIKFNVTSNSVMNSFFIPQLGGQIYAMAGMQTELNLIANESGYYKGISSNFSGPGFSGMKFTVIATRTHEEFTQWIKKVQKSSFHISNMSNYEQLAQPSAYHPITYFSNVESNLFNTIIEKFNCHKKKILNLNKNTAK